MEPLEVEPGRIRGARGSDRLERSSRLDGWDGMGSDSRSMRLELFVPRLRVSLSPP